MMSKVEKQREITKTVVDADFYCDFCGRKGTQDIGFGDKVNWAEKLPHNETTIVEKRTGYTYRDGEGSIKEESFHICTNCWDSILKPWLKSQNVTLTVRDHEF